jgi:hypothetical protein
MSLKYDNRNILSESWARFQVICPEVLYDFEYDLLADGLESMNSNPVTSLAWVRSQGDALVV